MIKKTFEDPNTLVCFTCSGPTNERIDSVMKITNMSTGKLGATVAEELLQEEDLGKLFYLSPKLAYKPKTKSEKLELISIESTIDLLKAIKKIISENKIFGVIHCTQIILSTIIRRRNKGYSFIYD